MAASEKTKQEEHPVKQEVPGLIGPIARIAELAYYKAEQRGFEPGHEMDDWLAAERELNL